MEIDFKQAIEFVSNVKSEMASLQAQLDSKDKEIEILKNKLKTIRQILIDTDLIHINKILIDADPEVITKHNYPRGRKSRMPKYKLYAKEWLAREEAKSMFNDMMEDNFVITVKNLKMLGIQNSESIYAAFRGLFPDTYYRSKKNSDELLQKYKERIECGYYKIYKESV